MDGATSLSGRVILVTGAAGHLGRAIAACLGEAGAEVVASDLVAGPGIVLQLDVASSEGWRRAADAIAQSHGRLDGLVHNAGILRPGALSEIAPEDWRASFAVNVDGVFLGTRACWPLLKASPSAAIVTLGSVSARTADRNLAAYNASKAAAVMATRAIALEGARLDPPIRANSVLPSFVDSPMVADLAAGAADPARAAGRMARAAPMGQLARAGEVARAVRWLLSPEAGFTTATELTVDGGLLA